MPQISNLFITQSLGLNPNGFDARRVHQSLNTDSRSIKRGDVFVALKGDNFDAHSFIPQAIAAGATGVVCSQSYKAAIKKDIDFFFVPDPLTAYRRLAGEWRKHFSIPIIVVAGAVGKTTTKEFLWSIFHGRYKSVLKTDKSQNGFIGIPLTLLSLNESHEAAIIEVGIDNIGAMVQHLDLIEPNASIVTAIAEEHLENLNDLETVTEEECKALTWVGKNGGVVAINEDDPWISEFAGRGELGPNTIHYGFSLKSSAKYEAANSALVVGKTSFPLLLPGIHNARNLLGAITLATAMGFSHEEILTGLKTFCPPPGRSEIVVLPSKVKVLCDYYNASPASMRAGLEMIPSLSNTVEGKVLACLGDMLELGRDELKLHTELAPQILRSNIHSLFLFGPRMRSLYKVLLEQGQSNVKHSESMDELITLVKKELSPGDFILIKGSRGMKMERIFEAIK